MINKEVLSEVEDMVENMLSVEIFTTWFAYDNLKSIIDTISYVSFVLVVIRRSK